MGSDREREGYRWEGDLLLTPAASHAREVGVWSCTRCGAAVTSTGIHDRWHADVDRDLAVATGERALDVGYGYVPLGAPGG